MYGARLSTWERSVEWPLMGAAVIFFFAYAVEILATPSGAVEETAEAIMWVTWAVFLVDYLARLVLAERRSRWFWRHLLDLAIVVLPMLRPLRLMRFLTIIALIQRGAGNVLRGHVVVYTVGATALTVVVAGLAVYDAERSAGSFATFGDAIWWAFVTVTTVGYGDYFPVTVTGRIVAVGLMIGGIALIGVVTATLASWIIERVSDATKPALLATEEHVTELRAEIAELKEMVARLAPPVASGPDDPHPHRSPAAHRGATPG